jgi:hypothetical protein
MRTAVTYVALTRARRTLVLLRDSEDPWCYDAEALLPPLLPTPAAAGVAFATPGAPPAKRMLGDSPAGSAEAEDADTQVATATATAVMLMRRKGLRLWRCAALARRQRTGCQATAAVRCNAANGRADGFAVSG